MKRDFFSAVLSAILKILPAPSLNSETSLRAHFENKPSRHARKTTTSYNSPFYLRACHRNMIPFLSIPSSPPFSQSKASNAAQLLVMQANLSNTSNATSLQSTSPSPTTARYCPPQLHQSLGRRPSWHRPSSRPSFGLNTKPVRLLL